jgi:hypothetical protein
MPYSTNFTCKHCGKFEDGEWNHNDQLIARELCFSCDFWMDKVPEANDPRSVRVDGVHYFIGPEHKGPATFSGFGGRKFVIAFTDGRQVTTRNLWCQGDIPESFQSLLPNNATFVQEN